MNIGKVPVEILERIVLQPINNNMKKRNDIVIRPKTGEDCSAVELEGELCIVSTDPITGASSNAGYLAVHINCNDVAASGGEPIGIMLTALLPENSSEALLEELMNGAYKAANEVGIEILGGHTEITNGVNRPIISGTVIGKTKNRKFISSSGAKVGQGVIMTKWAGLEGTAIIASDNSSLLKSKLGEEVVNSAIGMTGYISVVKEGAIATEFGATAMHDATEGGILGAVWEVADCSGTGVEIEIDKIPVRKETQEICNAVGINPYGLISSGSMIITAFEPEKLVEKLISEGITASIIGKITDGEKKILKNGVAEILEQPKSDELYKVNLNKK